MSFSTAFSFRDGEEHELLTVVRWALVITAAIVAGGGEVRAQQPEPRYFYAIEQLSTGDAVRRGALASADERADLILAPNTAYRQWLLETPSLLVGMVEFRTGDSGRRFSVPAIGLKPPITTDSDGDGLHDTAEFIIGTGPAKVDSDADGITDGAEILQGLDPLDGIPSRTGVIATIDTPGNAIAVAARNDIVVVGDGDRGVAIFNVFNRMRPLLIGQVDTPGSAEAVALSGSFVVVGDGAAGLTVIDISDPPAARIAQRMKFSSDVQAVAALADLAYVGESSGGLTIVDLDEGLVLGSRDIGREIQDIAQSGARLFALTSRSLVVFEIVGEGLVELSRIDVSGRTSPLEAGRHLFVGGGLAYVGHFTGYTIVDVSDPLVLRIVGTPPNPQDAVHDLAVAEQGLMVATTSFGGAQTLGVTVYDVTDPTDVTRFITSFDTPGVSRALSLYNGIAYIADAGAGLQVLNFMPADLGGAPPTGSISVNADNGTAVEGELVVISADVVDDVLVRNVEFSVNGQRVAVDGDFPFETGFRVPSADAGTSIEIGATASDTAGNRTVLEPVLITIIADTEAPVVSITNDLANAVIIEGDDVELALGIADNSPLASLSNSVRVFVDGAEVAVTRSSLSRWRIGALSFGTHTAFVEATDAAGNRGVSAEVQFTVTREVLSRMVSVGNTPPPTLEAISRTASVFRTSVIEPEAISRAISVTREAPQNELRVDFNQSGSPQNEFGYLEFNAGHESATTFIDPRPFDAFGTTVNVSSEFPDTTDARTKQMDERSSFFADNWLGMKRELLVDWIGVDTRASNGGNGDYDGSSGTPSRLVLRLSGLPNNTYRWRSYHHDVEKIHTPFRVEVSIDGGGSFTTVVASREGTNSTTGSTPPATQVYTGIGNQDPAMLPSTVEFNFEASGADVFVRFTPLSHTAVHTQILLVNGFELTVTSP